MLRPDFYGRFRPKSYRYLIFNPVTCTVRRTRAAYQSSHSNQIQKGRRSPRWLIGMNRNDRREKQRYKQADYSARRVTTQQHQRQEASHAA